MLMWIETKNDLPPVCTEVLGWHPAWVDEDYNPEGVCVCFLTDDDADTWMVSVWDNEQDTWQDHTTGMRKYNEQTPMPTHWMQKPTPPKK